VAETFFTKIKNEYPEAYEHIDVYINKAVYAQ